MRVKWVPSIPDELFLKQGQGQDQAATDDWKTPSRAAAKTKTSALLGVSQSNEAACTHTLLYVTLFLSGHQ